MQNTITLPPKTYAKPCYLPTMMPSILNLREGRKQLERQKKKKKYTNTESARGNTETTTAINTHTGVVHVTGSLASAPKMVDP